jgi:RHS repeat-associated protein
VTLPNGGGAVNLTYDPFGRRIQKASTGGTTTFLHDGLNSVEDVDGSGVVVARYGEGLGVDSPLATVRSNAISFYEADGIGSITSLTGTSSTITQSYMFDSFGKTTSNGASTNPFKYTGRDFDSETGLYYYRARYYNSMIGRFISEDPISFIAGINFYGYAANAPLRFVDPTGTSNALIHEEETLHAALDAGFSYSDAVRLSGEVPAVDFRQGSQHTDPASAHGHAMGGRKSNGNSESCQDAYQGAVEKLKQYMANGDVAGAIHEIQDSYASGHLYSPWHGLPVLSHLLGDAVYHPEAVTASANYLRAYNDARNFDSPGKYLAAKPANCDCGDTQ